MRYLSNKKELKWKITLDNKNDIPVTFNSQGPKNTDKQDDLKIFK